MVQRSMAAWHDAPDWCMVGERGSYNLLQLIAELPRHPVVKQSCSQKTIHQSSGTNPARHCQTGMHNRTETGSRKRKQMECSIVKLTKMEKSAITFDFDGLEAVTCDPSKLSESARETAMLMGIQAKIRDAAALSRKQPDGTVIEVTEALRRAEAVAMRDHLESGGAWNVRVAAAPKQNAAILALATRLGKTYAETEAILAGDAIAELMKSA